jgi:hypothetical protein
MVLFALAACSGPDDVDDSTADGEIVAFDLTLPHETAPLVRQVHVETDTQSTLRVVFSSGDHEVEVVFPEEATTHDHLLLGFRPGLTYDVTATATFSGNEADATVSTTTAGPWAHLPSVEIVTDDEARRAPGDTLIPLRCPVSGCGDPNELVFGIDAQGEIVYVLDVGGPEMPGGDTMQDVVEYDGGLLVLSGTTSVSAVHYAWDGTELARWRVGATEPDTVNVASAWAETFHHDLITHPSVPDHFLALGHYPLSGVEYPMDYNNPDLMDPNATISDDVALEFATDGTVVREAKLSDYLPTSRIGYDSLDSVNGMSAIDWAHGNAIQLDPADDGWVLSLRNQDAVVKIDPDAPGEVAWIAGVPDNWPPAFEHLLLTPVGSPFAWQFHQHAALFLDEGAGMKRLLVYDNGNAQTTPYSGVDPLVLPDVGQPLPAGLRSRVVAYTIDEPARTIRQDWTFDTPQGGTLFTEAVGDVDLLANGNAVSTWGFLQTLPGGTVWYEDAERGSKGVRIIEFDPATLDEIWHVHLSTDRAVNEEGVTAYRSERIAPLAGRVID